MGQIFVSHSARDRKYIDFLKAIFASLGVRAVFEEYESIASGRVTQQKIVGDILASDAVFLLATENVQALLHTRDWVLWEAGVAKDKPIWVFEPEDQAGRVSVLVPRLAHHVVFGMNDGWFRYIRAIVQSYDKSMVLPTAIGGGATLAFLLNPIAGLVGLVGTGILSNEIKKASRPSGLQITCCKCSSAYNVHLSRGVIDSRCPVCNTGLRILALQREVLDVAH